MTQYVTQCMPVYHATERYEIKSFSKEVTPSPITDLNLFLASSNCWAQNSAVRLVIVFINYFVFSTNRCECVVILVNSGNIWAFNFLFMIQ
jgi:hypothetical protein